MNRKIMLLVLLFTTITFFNGFYIPKNNKNNLDKHCQNRMCLYIESNKDSYEIDEAVYIDVKLINKSDKIYQIHHIFNECENLLFDVIDKNNNTLTQGNLDAVLPYNGEGDFIELHYNKYFGEVFLLNEGGLLDFKFRKGKFKIKARYIVNKDIKKRFCKIIQEYGNSCENIDQYLWTKTLESNEIEIKVK